MRLYNTLGRRLQDLAPIQPSQVSIYSCGPTVYQTAHLGNFRTYIFSDVLRRSLEYAGFAVNHVMNITDVGHLTDDADAGQDKVEESARKERKSVWEIAAHYEQQFWRDAEVLHILRPTTVCKATDHIPEQIALVEQLERGGFTYTIEDGVYFSVEQFPQYGILTGQSLAEKEAGARVAVNTSKRHPADFALWKFSYPGGRSFDATLDDPESRRQMEWESPWGTGYPGWHIECSAMSTKYLGQPFDIHTGGIDHISPHHTNEIAQSEAVAGKPLAHVWLHGDFMLVDGQKMSKSIGNVVTVDDLIRRGHNPLAFRMLALMTHYRKPLNFTWEALQSAEQALANLYQLVRRLPKPAGDVVVGETFEQQFRSALADDLNLPQALAVLWEVVKSDLPAPMKAAAVLQWDTVFGLDLALVIGETIEIPKDILDLLNEREMYRAAGQYDKADSIRDELTAKGYEIQDGPDGAVVVPTVGPTPL